MQDSRRQSARPSPRRCHGPDPRRPVPAPSALGFLGIAVLAASFGVVRAIEAGNHPGLLADALTLDLLVTVPLAYWFLAVHGAGGLRGPNHLRAVILGSERQVVELDAPLEATGFYGIRRRVRSIGLSVDEPLRFLEGLERRLVDRRD